MIDFITEIGEKALRISNRELKVRNWSSNAAASSVSLHLKQRIESWSSGRGLGAGPGNRTHLKQRIERQIYPYVSPGICQPSDASQTEN